MSTLLSLALLGLASSPTRVWGAEPAVPNNRIELPGASLALDDTSDSVSGNPALFGFDPDPDVSLLYRTGISDPSVSFQTAATAGGLGMGLYYTGAPESGSLWALSAHLAVGLAEDWSLGSSFRWNLPQGTDNNFTSWDLGLGWRPLYWLGFGAAARNIGNPSPEWGAAGSYGVGVALRPLGDALSLGFDHLFLDPFVQGDGERASSSHVNKLVLRSEPLRGLVVRLHATDEIELGAGLEFYFGHSGVGVYGSGRELDLTSPMLTAGLLSSSPPRRAIGGGRRIPEFKLSEDYPYVPRASFFEPRGESYLHLLKRLRECASDASVRGVLIRLDGMPFSLAQVEEIRRVIKTIRASGRPVVVYLDEDVGNAGYYLATAADRVLAHPAMTLDLIGLSAEMLYYRGILDTLGVGMQYAARSEYKSAIEPLTRNGPSPASIEQLNALLDDLHGGLVDAIAEGRGRTREEAQALLDEGPWTAREALEKGLIEGVAYPDEFDELLAGTFPKHFTLDDRYRVRDGTTGWANPRRIAVVTVAGAIVSGPSEGPGLFGGEETAGSETVVKALEQAARDDTVKAVVLRVDSPGGSAFASDQIWRGVEMVQRAQKPVVVSMGGYAASGGYYVSAGADAILALPSTVTGSIGVFGGKVNFEGLFDKAGIESWEILRGRKAGMWSMARPMDPTEMDALDHLIGETYSQFKGKVAEGRGLDADRVEGLARGRVWSGRRAIENGLVDQEGGFFEAVDLAREKAGLSARTRYDLITYAAVPNAMDELPSEFLRAALRIDKAPASLGVLSRLRRLEEERLWMMLPYEMEIR